MTLEELREKDQDFNASLFIGKVNNMLKKIYNAITLNELDTVKHFLSESAFQKIQEKNDEVIQKGNHLNYEEVNVNSVIRNVDDGDDYYRIEVYATIKYLQYVKSNDGKIISGNDENRVTTNRRVLLTKLKNTNDKKGFYRCLGCGATLDINDNGKCSHCGRIFNLEEFDYIIDSIE